MTHFHRVSTSHPMSVEKAEGEIPNGLPTAGEPRRGDKGSLRPVRRLLVAGQPLTTSEIALLVEEGIGVTQISDAREALQLVTSGHRFDAIVTDPGSYDPDTMEKSTGFAMVEALRRRGERTPVFMVQREIAGLGNWVKSVREAGGQGFATDLLGLEATMRSVGLTLFADPSTPLTDN
jgi:CheY-like chemotaxis protein